MRSIRIGLPEGYRRDVWLLCIASGLGAGAYLGLQQLLTPLFLLRIGYGPELLGTVSAVGAVSFSASSAVGGALGSKMGPRGVMRLGVLITMMGIGLFPLAELVPESFRFLWVLFGQMVSSSGWAFFVVNVIAAIAAFAAPEQRRGAYALREAFAGLGTFGGSFVGGLLPGVFASLLGSTTEVAWPYRVSLWAALVVAVAWLVPLALVAPVQASRSTGSTAGHFRPSLPLVLLLLVAFLNNGAHASCKSFASAYMDRVFHLPTALIGAVTSAGMFMAIPAALSSPQLSKGRGNGFVMGISSLGVAAGLAIMGTVPHWLGTAAGLIGVYAILAFWRPAFQALQMDIAEPQWRAVVSGASAMGMSLGFGSVSWTGGYVVTHWGYRSEFLLGAGLAVLAGLVAMLLQRRLCQGAMAEQGLPSLKASSEPAAH
ncbi:MAG: MFS transporter [Chloroflexi bacterium]|nr:MFS transporter [Chloroflexota bacterium]